MIVGDVVAEIADALSTVPGLRVFEYLPGTVTPPAAIIPPPTDVLFDETYGRGCDRLTLVIYVIVGIDPDRSTTARLNGYLSGSGESSIKAAIEAKTYSALDDLRVVSAEAGPFTIGGIDLLGASFTVDVAGTGG